MPTNARPPQQPPEAPPPQTDEEVVQGALDEMAAKLARARGQADFGQVVGETVLAGILGERKRVVTFLNGEAQKAAGAARAMGQGNPAEAAKAQFVASLLAGLAHLVGQPPGPACATCGGSRVISSRVVTASGQQATAPCPDCASPRAPAAAGRQRLTSVPPEPGPPTEERH